MYLYDDQFSEKHDFAPVASPEKVLIIASTARCGSHMLGHALYSTKKFGFPLEYANPGNLKAWKERFGTDDLLSTLGKIKQCRTSPNGVFAAKFHYSHIKQFGKFSQLRACFPNAYYVLLSRKNVLNQAVSLSIANQTGVWISGQKPINENPEYNFDHIDMCLRHTIIDNASWRYTLAANGCNYIELDFDYARDNLTESIKHIADFMGIDVNDSDIPQEQVTKKQSGGRNKEWAERFAASFNDAHDLLYVEKPSLRKKVKNKLKKVLGMA